MSSTEHAEYPKVDWTLFLPVKGETEEEKKARLAAAIKAKNETLKKREEYINNLPESERIKFNENKLKRKEEKLKRKAEKLKRKEDKLKRKENEHGNKDKKKEDYHDKNKKKERNEHPAKEDEVEISMDEFAQFKSWENQFKKKRVNAMKYQAFCEWRSSHGQVDQHQQH